MNCCSAKNVDKFEWERRVGKFMCDVFKWAQTGGRKFHFSPLCVFKCVLKLLWGCIFNDVFKWAQTGGRKFHFSPLCAFKCVLKLLLRMHIFNDVNKTFSILLILVFSILILLWIEHVVVNPGFIPTASITFIPKQLKQIISLFSSLFQWSLYFNKSYNS